MARSRRRNSVLRRFRVVDRSMEPTLHDGEVLVAIRSRRARVGQIRVFPHPHHPAIWVVKRVGEVSPDGERFTAVADNADAAGVTDSASFGLVKVAGSYRVLIRPRRRTSERSSR